MHYAFYSTQAFVYMIDWSILVQIQGLQNLYEYLRDAESQLTADSTGKPTVPYATNGGSEVPVAAGAGDTNICGGIIQLYWNSILERSLDTNDQVRHAALKVITLTDFHTSLFFM
jgi:cohesin loading factor subunit SCC2